ncbi:DUF4350 domain-containing protein [Nocardioides sp.]|uniref:DUF4350 domain-containing protein n=1 Tax=Nocardioides sp. TaxID=35761 RepID=UPI0026114116|nr:DUF4350 domain-containing protein [Nocardioides sp.]
MTTLPTPATATAPPETGPVTGWRRHRSTLLIVGALFAALALVVLTQGPVTRAADLDPDNPGPDGAQAVAGVLDDQGVDVEVVRSASALETTALDADSLVVVTSSSDLGTSTTSALLDQVTGADAALVVVDPGARLLDALDVDGGPTRVDVGDGVPGSCDDPTYDDLVLVVDSADALPLDGCFSDALAAQGTIGGDLTLLGAGELLSNDQVLRGDNAAIALRLLGGRERLVWYVASPDDLVADDGVGITSLLPDWIFPGLAILLLSTVLLVLWRGRRLGPLASEPLPVVVKAIETTRSRGGLYRRSGDLAHAADALRAATRSRTGDRLRLGAHAGDAVVVGAVARHVGRPESEVAALIGAEAHVPASDRDLIVLANDLAALEEEVRRS